MLTKDDLQYARTCSEGLQKLYDFSHEWYRLHGLSLPWLVYFRDQVLQLHTELDRFVTDWDRDPPSDANHLPNPPGVSPAFSGNF